MTAALDPAREDAPRVMPQSVQVVRKAILDEIETVKIMIENASDAATVEAIVPNWPESSPQ